MNICRCVIGWLKCLLRPIYYFIRGWDKYKGELRYWRIEFGNGNASSPDYRKVMLAMAEQDDERFISDKIVADFGCGPLGTLTWATSASLRIGIDVLMDLYADTFSENIISHGMVYVKSTESIIPLPSGFVDVLYTMNAMDHVNNFAVMCAELLRILKPRGEFIGSFNLEEPCTLLEPQTLTEEIINKELLSHLRIESYRVVPYSANEGRYAPFFEGHLNYKKGQMGVLWVRARKPTESGG